MMFIVVKIKSQKNFYLAGCRFGLGRGPKTQVGIEATKMTLGESQTFTEMVKIDSSYGHPRRAPPTKGGMKFATQILPLLNYESKSNQKFAAPLLAAHAGDNHNCSLLENTVQPLKVVKGTHRFPRDFD